MTRMLIVVALAVVAVLAPPPAHAAQPSAAFLARPADGAPTASGGWFLYERAAPGTVLSGRLAVRNDSAEPLTLRVAAADAETAQQGGVSYSLPDEKLDAVGRWVELSRDTVELGPGEGDVVPFTVEVPDGARPGDHLAGIAVWAPRAGAGPSPARGLTAGVVIQTRQVVAVQVAVPGAASRELQVEGVQVAARATGAYLDVRIANTGTLLTEAEGRVLVDGVAQRFTVDTMVPGASFGLPVAWPSDDLDSGRHVVVELDYEGGSERWEGTVNVDEDVRRALEGWAVPGAERPGPGTLVSLLVALVAALLILLSSVRWWRGRAGEVAPNRQLVRIRSS